VTTEVCDDATGMERVGSDAHALEATVQLDGEEYVGGLRLSVGFPLVVGALLEVDIVEDDGREAMPP
jgi:hypothetical protein